MKRLTVPTMVVSAGVAVAWLIWTGTFGRIQSTALQEPVVLDCSCTRILDDFADERMREALLRHLAASAGWYVTADWGIVGPDKRPRRVLVAEKRMAREKMIDDLFAQPTRNTINVTLRFDPAPPINRHAARYVLAPAGAETVNLPLVPAADDSNTHGSRLMVAGNFLLLLIEEYSVGRDRPLTKKAIQQVVAELAAVKDNLNEIERVGYVQQWMPTDSVKESKVNLPLEISGGVSRGMYRVTGYANPQEKGYLTIRTFHSVTGKELDPDVNSWRTVQYIGWSTRPNDKFFFECELAGPSYLTDDELRLEPSDPRRFQAMAAPQEIRIEVWFHGKQQRKLLEVTEVLVPWMR